MMTSGWVFKSVTQHVERDNTDSRKEGKPEPQPEQPKARRGRPPVVKDKKLLEAALRMWELKNSPPKKAN